MIHWGTKHVYRRLGYVADFCPLCRGVRAFELIRVGLAGHIYYISLTQGELVGHRARCTSCGTEFVTAPEVYARPSTQAGALPELIKLTFPNLARHYASRLALEKAIRDPFAKISQADRQWLLREPFKLLSFKAEERFRSSRINRESIAVFLTALFVGAAAASGLVSVLPQFEEAIWITLAIAAAVATWLQSHWSRSKFVRHDVLGPLLSALHPLKPTREEVAGILGDMKALGLRIGSRITADMVMEGLRSYVPAKVA